MSENSQLISWLAAAGAVEASTEAQLADCILEFAPLPQIQAQFARHRIETRGHAEKVDQCLRLLDASQPAAAGCGADGPLSGESSAAPGDDSMLDRFLLAYATESEEIARYTSLIAAAEQMGENEIAEICREILEDEIQMAAWLEERIPEVTRNILNLATAR